jgi:hypothetical protein
MAGNSELEQKEEGRRQKAEGRSNKINRLSH